jgi:hypothetical protein
MPQLFPARGQMMRAYFLQHLPRTQQADNRKAADQPRDRPRVRGALDHP